MLCSCLWGSLRPPPQSSDLGHSSIHTGYVGCKVWTWVGWWVTWSPAPRPRDTLTYSEFLPEDGLLAQGGAVPAAESELVLALIDAHLRPLPDHNDGIGAALADGTLPWGQARNLVADDVGS